MNNEVRNKMKIKTAELFASLVIMLDVSSEHIHIVNDVQSTRHWILDIP